MMSRGPLQVLRESHRTRRLLTLILASSGFYLGARVLAAKLLVAMLYHPFRYKDDPRHDRMLRQFRDAFGQKSYQLDEVDFSIPSSSGRDGLEQRAFLLHPKGPPTGDLWMVFGGNAMVGSDWLDFCLTMLSWLPASAAERPAFLLVDYPGYGASDGTASPRTILQAQLAGLRAALPRLAAFPGRLHLLGHSLGAAAASQLAVSLKQEASRGESKETDCEANPVSALKPGRLVLSAPFLNIDAMAQAIFGKYILPSWLLRILLTERWNNSAWVPEAARAGWDVSIILGTRDEIVPTSQGKALRDSVKRGGQSCSFVEVKKAGHNDIIDAAPQQYAALMGFAPAARGDRGAAL